MKVLRGTRWPALAAACAMLIIGAGAADAPFAPAYATYYLSRPVEGGVEGCPALAGSTFDPRELCAADLGDGWIPVDAVFLQACPPGPIIYGAVLVSGTVNVSEHIISEPDSASAIADVGTHVSCDLKLRSKLFGPFRKLPAISVPGTAAEAQLAIDLPGGGAGITTVMAIGDVVIAVGVDDDGGAPDRATVLRIVNSAIHRFENPRSFSGPFPRVLPSTSAVHSAPPP